MSALNYAAYAKYIMIILQQRNTQKYLTQYNYAYFLALNFKILKHVDSNILYSKIQVFL